MSPLRRARLQALLAALVFGVFLSACASAPEGDPLEPVNRASHSFNKGVDTIVLRPTAQAYGFVTPTLVKHLVGNALGHMSLPKTFLNAALQGNVERSVVTLGRFAVNTIVGAGGLLDPATEFGLPYYDEDFGQTLAVWGVGEGPYVELPLLGPRTTRGVVGTAVDTVTNPLSYLTGLANVPAAANVARTGVKIIDARWRSFDLIDEGLYGEGDSYGRLKSFYLQRLRNEVSNGESGVDALPDIYEAQEF